MKPRTSSKSTIIITFVTIIITFIIFTIYAINGIRLNKSGVYTYATVSEILDTNLIKLYYKVNESKIEITKERNEDFILGEKFQIKYHPKTPKLYKIYFDRPVFSEKEIIDSTKGTILKKNNTYIVFKYFVDSTLYLKSSTVLKKHYKQIQNGDEYKVFYNVENKKQAIINYKGLTKGNYIFENQ